MPDAVMAAPVLFNGVPVLIPDPGGGITPPLVPALADDPCDCCAPPSTVVCELCEGGQIPTPVSVTIAGMLGDPWSNWNGTYVVPIINGTCQGSVNGPAFDFFCQIAGSPGQPNRVTPGVRFFLNGDLQLGIYIRVELTGTEQSVNDSYCNGNNNAPYNAIFETPDLTTPPNPLPCTGSYGVPLISSFPVSTLYDHGPTYPTDCDCFAITRPQAPTCTVVF